MVRVHRLYPDKQLLASGYSYISDLYSLELDTERVIPKYLDSRLQKDDDDLEEKQGKPETSRPQRQAALRGIQKTQDQYDSGQV